VAISSTTARPMSLTPISIRKSTEFACLNAPFPADAWERLSFHWSRWQGKGSVALAGERFNCTPNTRLMVNLVAAACEAAATPSPSRPGERGFAVCVFVGAWARWRQVDSLREQVAGSGTIRPPPR
jgi:hypothetical protein